jgi:hypothetical protein
VGRGERGICPQAGERCAHPGSDSRLLASPHRATLSRTPDAPGPVTLIVEEVGDVAGKDLLHLPCHFGLDTLAWARRGARVTRGRLLGAGHRAGASPGRRDRPRRPLRGRRRGRAPGPRRASGGCWNPTTRGCRCCSPSRRPRPRVGWESGDQAGQESRSAGHRVAASMTAMDLPRLQRVLRRCAVPGAAVLRLGRRGAAWPGPRGSTGRSEGEPDVLLEAGQIEPGDADGDRGGGPASQMETR